MNPSYEPFPQIIDPFVIHFLTSSIEPPPPLPWSIFFYDPFLVVPSPPPMSISTPSSPEDRSFKSSAQSNRHRYTPLQLFTLHRIFSLLPYPSLHERRLIAEHLNVDIEQVRIWFSNRRSRKRESTAYKSNLIQPTADESIEIKPLFDRLNLPV